MYPVGDEDGREKGELQVLEQELKPMATKLQTPSNQTINP